MVRFFKGLKMKTDPFFRVCLILGLPLPLLLSQYKRGDEFWVAIQALLIGLFLISIIYVWRRRAFGSIFFSIYYALFFILFIAKFI